MKLAFETRLLAPSQVPAVVHLARRVWQVTYPGIISQAQIDYMLAQRYDAAWLMATLDAPGQCWWVASTEEALLGFCHLLLPSPGEAKLDKLYVDPDHQGRGVGRALLDVAAVEARAQGCREWVLAVNKHNTAAQAAYRRYGFVVREAVCADIGNGFVMDDYVMAQSLA